MKKLILFSLIALTSSAYADTLYGIYADVDYWHTQADVTQSNSKYSHKNTAQLMAAVSVEHPIPLIPNVRLRHTTLTADNKAAISELDAKNTDVIAYYELLDNVVSLDVGLGAKRIDGDINAFGNTQYTLNKTLPMAYASVGAKLPFTGLSAKAELGLAQGTNTRATDAQAEIKYDFVDKALIDIGAKAGYRVLNLDYDKAKSTINREHISYQADFKGPYIGLEVHF